MPNHDWPSIHAKRMRLTKLNACGVPISTAGNKSMLVTKGVVKIGMNPEYEEGEETLTKNGNGEIDWQHVDPSLIKYVGIEVQFTRVNPEAFTLITGQPLVLNAAGRPVGFRLTTDPIEVSFALETWSDIPDGACDSEHKPYGYFALPYIGTGQIGGFEISGSAAEFTLSAKTKPGTGWGAGPYAVVRDEDGVPVPLLDPFTGNTHFTAEETTVAPPAVTDGATLLTPYTPPVPGP